MGLFDKFRKNKNEASESSGEIYQPAEGELIALEEVSDPVFSKKMMGDGFAVVPDSGKILSPIDGEVGFVADTLHGLGLKGDKDFEVLIHIGLDTVELKGEGFEINVKQGDHVTKGQVLGQIDVDFIKEKGYDPTIILVVTSLGSYENMDIDINSSPQIKLH